MTLVVENDRGSVTVPDSVLVGIAVHACEQIDGVRVRRRRAIDLDARAVRLAVAVRRGEPLADAGERAQDSVAAALSAACGIDFTVDVSIGELV